jgi:hypothetical protein
MTIRNICALLLSSFGLLVSTSATAGQQAEVTFQCPKTVIYNIAPVQGWVAGMSSMLVLPFSDINTDKNQVSCNYQQRYGSGTTSAMLTAYAPKNYRCQVPGNVGQYTVCKPAVPPIKKKSNN